MIRVAQFIGSIILVAWSLAAYSAETETSNKETRTICDIQERLTELGFSPGPIDGLVGQKTRNAVQSFLKKMNPEGETFSAPQVVEFLKAYAVSNNTNTVQTARPKSNPANGKFFFDNGKNGLAPLEIKTAKQGYDYYIKLSDFYTNNPIRTIYLRSGSSIQIKVPLGSHMLKYATGELWFGEKCLFGYRTRYNKADSEFVFEQVENQYSGYSVELIVQEDGNLATEELTPDEW